MVRPSHDQPTVLAHDPWSAYGTGHARQAQPTDVHTVLDGHDTAVCAYHCARDGTGVSLIVHDAPSHDAVSDLLKVGKGSHPDG